MRVDLNLSAQSLQESANGATAPANAANSSTASEGLGQDQAQLSGAAAQIQALTAQAAQLPDIRQERVSSLRQVVESGSYDPQPEDVADAMMAYMTVQPAA
jgi:flagellar biosynthesis anti-sigma factor FlgM